MGGVVWLVRNNQNYVNQSLALEDAAALQTVQLQYFADVISGRTAIGHDREGRVVIGQVNGKTEKRGFVHKISLTHAIHTLHCTLNQRSALNLNLIFRINLYDFADLLISMGVVNAINLDGGGSSTIVY